MIETYSTNITMEADTFIPFNSVAVIKGCTVTKPSADTINLNKCGVYMIACAVSTSASTTIQLYKNGVAQPQAQSTGVSPNFVTLVQVDRDNSCCACSSPTTIQIQNSAAGTFTDANLVVTKIV